MIRSWEDLNLLDDLTKRIYDEKPNLTLEEFYFCYKLPSSWTENYKKMKTRVYMNVIKYEKEIIKKIPILEDYYFSIEKKPVGIKKRKGNNDLIMRKYKQDLNKEVYIENFSLYPLKYQPSGYLNFENIKTGFFNLKLNEKVEEYPVTLNMIARRYNLLQFRNNKGIIII
jgi:hypothetical protein